MKVRISESQLSSKDSNYFECEGCGRSWKKIYFIEFSIKELWLCPECLEKLKGKLNKGEVK